MPPSFFEKLGDYIIDVLKRQGAVVLCLAFAVWYFYRDNEQIKGEQIKCSALLDELKVEIIKSDQEIILKNSQSLGVFSAELARNTSAIDRLIKNN